MLTRLKVQGFKNLVDAEIHFGPFTCIAGPNGVGKSNLFDAIRFLSLLADEPFVKAAGGVRGGQDLRELFTLGGDGRMVFDCDVLIPGEGVDDFEQPAEASKTYLNYRLELRLGASKDLPEVPRVVLEREELGFVKKDDARRQLGFPHKPDWRSSVLGTSGRQTTFIKSEPQADGDHRISLQSDRMRAEGQSKRGGGRPTDFLASPLPRTVLSSAQNADETRTAVLLRQEMRRWRQLQLEPSALRRPDDFQSPRSIDPSGAHLAATLYRLASTADDPEVVYAEVANRLAELVEGVRRVRVDRDEGRQLLRFMMEDRSGAELPASSLSDGTLRFVALAIMERDPQATGVLCLEEPENGIHPLRVEAMLELLEDMAVDAETAVDEFNPLRQVIVTTHSPVVFGDVSEDDAVLARPRSHPVGNRIVRGVDFVCLQDTWRSELGVEPVATGVVHRYLTAAGALRRATRGDRALRTAPAAKEAGSGHDAPAHRGAHRRLLAPAGAVGLPGLRG